MGSTITVERWVFLGSLSRPKYRYELVYMGENWIAAVYHAIRAKRLSRCVKVEWR